MARRPVDVTMLSDRAVIDHFFKHGVQIGYFKDLNFGIEGLPAEEKSRLLSELNDSITAFYTDTEDGKVTVREIESYLLHNGYGRGDIKMSRSQQDFTSRAQREWKYKMAHGHSTESWWILIKLQLEKVWFNLRHRRK